MLLHLLTCGIKAYTSHRMLLSHGQRQVKSPSDTPWAPFGATSHEHKKTNRRGRDVRLC